MLKSKFSILSQLTLIPTTGVWFILPVRSIAAEPLILVVVVNSSPTISLVSASLESCKSITKILLNLLPPSVIPRFKKSKSAVNPKSSTLALRSIVISESEPVSKKNCKELSASC